MILPITTLDGAFNAFLAIPSSGQLFDEKDREYVNRLLASTTGTLKLGGIGYRVHAAAATYVGSHPDTRFLKRHDGTEVGDIDALVSALNEAQALEDKLLFVPDGSQPGSNQFLPFAGMTIRGRPEP